jgi:hypothetical protein
VTELYRWLSSDAADLRDGLTPKDVVDALHAPTTLRMDNRVPLREPTFMVVRADRRPATHRRHVYASASRRAMDHRRGSRRRYERAADVEEAHVMSKKREDLAGVSGSDAAAFAMNNDLSDLFDEAEVVRERRPAKMVTALRIDLGIQAELEAAAAARGIGSSTLMRQIIEEWVLANRDAPAPDQLGELVRHLDAARQAATSLARPAA